MDADTATIDGGRGAPRCAAVTLLLLVACADTPAQPPLPLSEAEVIWTSGGHQDDGGLIVADLRSGALDPDGLVLLAESGRMAGSGGGLVHLLSSRGEHLATIGRRGRGPGEYEAVGGAGFGPDSLIWMTDPALGRIMWFSRSGAFIRTESRPRERVRGSPWFLYPHIVMPDGAVLGAAVGADEADSIPVGIWPADGAVQILPAARLHSPLSLLIGRGVSSQRLSANPLIGAAAGSDWLFVLDRAPAAGRDGVIGIDRYDSTGRHLGRTEIPYVARDVDATVTDWLEGWARAYADALPDVRADDVLAAMWIPDRLPPVEQAIADAHGYWLRRERTSEGLWQRYDLSGNLLVNLKLPPDVQALAANDSTIVGWQLDSLMTPLVRKYRIRARAAVPEQE